MRTLAGCGVTAHAAVAGRTPKEHGDDRAEPLRAIPSGAGFVICDGVGSLEDSAAVAQECVTHVVSHVAEHGAAGVLTCAVAAAADMRDAAAYGATTLIAVAAGADAAVHWTLVGNGSVFELEALDVRGGRARLGVAELAIPHISYDDGRPALRSTIPSDPATELDVSGGTLLPRQRRMRAIVACTDGLASQEDWREATSSEGTRLREIPPPLAALLDRFAEAWTELAGATDPEERVGELLAEVLDGLVEEGAVTDDVTVGVLLLVPPRS